MRSVLTRREWKKLLIKYSPEGAVAASKPAPPTIDDLLSTISKFIPGEAIAVFLGSFTVLEGALPTTPVNWIGFVMFLISLAIAIGISYYKASRETVEVPGYGAVPIPNKYPKTIIPAVAFFVWAINIEGFLAIIKSAVPLYDPIIGGLALLVYTTLIPFLYILYSGK